MDLVATNDLKTRAKKAYEESIVLRPLRASKLVKKTLGAHVPPKDWKEHHAHGMALTCEVGGYTLGVHADDPKELLVKTEDTSEWVPVESVVHLGRLTHEWEEALATDTWVTRTPGGPTVTVTGPRREGDDK